MYTRCMHDDKVARYSFSGSIPPPEFEHKLRRLRDLENCQHGCIIIKMKICQDQGCNDTGIVIATKWRHILLAAVSLGTGTVLPKSFTGTFFSNSHLNVREVYAKSVRVSSRYFGMMVRNTVNNGPSWCSAVICRNDRNTFHKQVHHIVSIVLRMCLTDHGDSSSGLLERRIWLVHVCIEALKLAVR